MLIRCHLDSSPALYQKYLSVPVVDEWELSRAMRDDTGPGGGIDQLEEHYKTFIVSRPLSIKSRSLTAPPLDRKGFR
jgi:hypothetical protein